MISITNKNLIHAQGSLIDKAYIVEILNVKTRIRIVKFLKLKSIRMSFKVRMSKMIKEKLLLKHNLQIYYKLLHKLRKIILEIKTLIVIIKTIITIEISLCN